ncbi:hypothetical protein HWV62_44748 [Athelia sp. TMB]|nr:hypothetical protein HWV62_44748 [Athelia sp. TMB]
MSYDFADIKCNQLPLKKLGRAGSFYVKISVDGQEQYRTAPAQGRTSVSWNGTCFLEVLGSSSVEVQVYERHTIRGAKCTGSLNESVDKLLKECGTSGSRLSSCCQWELIQSAAPASVARKLQDVDKLETGTSITFSVARIPQNTGVASNNQIRWEDGPTHPVGSSTTSTNARLFATAPALTSATPQPSVNVAQPDTKQLQIDEALASAQVGIDRIQAAPPAIDKLNQAIGVSSGAMNTLNSFATIWGSLIQKIELFVDVADKLAEVIIAQRDRDEALCNLMKTVEEIHSFMIEANPLKIVASQRKILEDMGLLTVESAYLIRDFTIDKSFWKRIATLTLSGVEAKIKQYNAQFKQLEAAFQTHAVVNIEITAFRCLVQVEEIALHCEGNAYISAAKNITFQDMAYAKGAGYDLDRCCLPGTRSDILTELHEWINMSDEDGTPRVMVLAGVAGCGKTAISNSIARHYDRMKRLGSSVFFERADQVQRHCGNLLSTVARDIANLDTQWRSALYEVIKGNDSLRQTRSVSRQWESFILEPAKSLNVIGPIVVVIDALDESGEAAARRDLLRSLAKNAAELPANFRILVTTRAEDDIWRAFTDQRNVQLKTMDFSDHKAIDEDIARFIETQLADIADILEKKMPDKKWCSGLVRASDHLFQWAATACLAILLRQGGYTPEEITVDLISNKRNLDGLYTTILAREFNEHDELVMGRFRRVMGNILAAKEPLSMQSHRALWRQCDEEDIVGSIVGPLGSLLSGSKGTDIAVSALHTSFFDFLKDCQRSGAYYVDPTQQNQHLALASLRIMKAELKFNICGLETSQKPNEAVSDLAARIQCSVSSVLSYSCRFLGSHFAPIAQDAHMHTELKYFLFERFLYWLEVLSLEKHINLASRSLDVIMTWTQKYSPELTAFVKDGISFVNVFAQVISESAPHIYVSALPFAPKHSLVSKTYSWRYPGLLRLSSGSLDTWPAALKTIEGHTRPVRSVSYSPDGKHIVSGSQDRSICLWDSETGEIAAGPFTGHSSYVMSVKYSPNGRFIASGSWDNTVRIWDALRGEMVVGPFEGHTGRINSVAWSPDGKRVVSGSEDGTCRVWDVEAGGPVVGRWFEGDSGSINSVVYSPDGQHIACGSSDGTIHVVDAETREIVGTPFEGHTDVINSIDFSPNGKHVVSGASDKTTRVWDIATGDTVIGPVGGHRETGEMAVEPFARHSGTISSVAFSPDGQRVASGSQEKTIRVWDIKTGQLITSPFQGHSEGVSSVVFSPDGKHIASGSHDKTIRIWDVETGKTIAGPFTAHSWFLTSVAYSGDGKYLVSGSWDGTIRVWNVKQALERAKLSGSDVGFAGFSDDCPINKGWVSTVSGDLLFWVPSWHREELLWPSNIALNRPNLTRLDQSMFVHGVRWQECRGLEMVS